MFKRLAPPAPGFASEPRPVLTGAPTPWPWRFKRICRPVFWAQEVEEIDELQLKQIKNPGKNRLKTRRYDNNVQYRGRILITYHNISKRYIFLQSKSNPHLFSQPPKTGPKYIQVCVVKSSASWMLYIHPKVDPPVPALTAVRRWFLQDHPSWALVGPDGGNLQKLCHGEMDMIHI